MILTFYDIVLKHNKNKGMLRRCFSLLAASRRPKKHMYRMYVPGAMNPLSKPSEIPKGSLHVVSLPIGNVKDFSLRALDVLKNADYVVCYSRNHFKVLMELIEIPAEGRLIQYKHGDTTFLGRIVMMLKQGHSIAFVTLSGTPTFGDPGAQLIQTALRRKLKVTCVPGPCSIIAALTISGIDYSEGFHFAGYLPSARGARLTKLKQLLPGQSVALVFFEAPERVQSLLEDISTLYPQRRVSVVHEVTKAYEAVHSDEAEKLAKYYAEAGMHLTRERGEDVVCVEAPPAAVEPSLFNAREVMHHVTTLVENGHNKVSAMQLAASNLGLSIPLVMQIVRVAEQAAQRKEDDDALKEVSEEKRLDSSHKTSQVHLKRQQRRLAIQRLKEKVRLVRLKAARMVNEPSAAAT